MQATAQLIDVACDGMVEEHESDTWRSIEKELMEMVGAGLAVIFARG
jgi:hypothetical protein